MILPPIDAHAHIETRVPARDLAGLGAFVVAVTREPGEWTAALRRRDELAVWGIGVHPGLPNAIASFDEVEFAGAVDSSLFVGEVGLDGRAKTPPAEQLRVFDAVLAVLQDVPRPTTIHSVSASRRVLDALSARPIAAPILHWWRGTTGETQEAIEMGCFFSLNGAELKSPRVLDLLPPERVLTETDFPHSSRRDRAATQPGATTTIERALLATWGVDELQLRRRLWRTLVDVYERCDLTDRLPEPVQDIMLTAGLS